MVCTAMSLADAQTLAEKDHPGARASRPHKTWHDRREPRKGGFDALCKRVAVVGRLFAGIRCGRDARAPGGMSFRTQTGARRNTSDFDTSQPPANSSSAGTDSTPSEQVDLMAVSAMSLADAQTLAEKDHPGARASRPHKTWHDRRDPRSGGLGALCKRVAVVGRLFAGIRCGRDARAPGGMSDQGRRSWPSYSSGLVVDCAGIGSPPRIRLTSFIRVS